MFMGPLEATQPWQTGQLAGVVRFRDRVISVVRDAVAAAAAGGGGVRLEGSVERAMHRTIAGVTSDIERLAFNTAISKLMVFTNLLRDQKGKVPVQAVEALVLLLAPIAPHASEECWELLGHSDSLAKETWPTFEESLCVEEGATIVVQVNGKVRAKAEVPSADMTQDEAMALAGELPQLHKWLHGKEVKKVIYVKGRMLSIVTGK